MISLILVTLAGVVKAFMDAAAHGKIKGSDWWNEDLSWNNKWKNGDKKQGEAFIGSSTVFVFLTSGWHLLQFVFLNLIISALVLYKPIVGSVWDFLILSAALRIPFQIIYGRFK